jgi:hypothetical protein
MLSGDRLQALGLDNLANDLGSLYRFEVKRLETHLEIGRRAANRDVDQESFRVSFDVRPLPAVGGATSRAIV